MQRVGPRRCSDSTALIWNGGSNRIAACTPSISSVVVVPGPVRPLPKMETAPPGAIPLVKVAALTTAAR